jgi:hypothetical protein
MSAGSACGIIDDADDEVAIVVSIRCVVDGGLNRLSEVHPDDDIRALVVREAPGDRIQDRSDGALLAKSASLP